MTVKQRLQNMLMQNGMSETQANDVLELALPELNKMDLDYKITFDSPEKDYPNIMYSLWFQTIKPIALKWIDENKPMAWFRGMFVSDCVVS